MKNPHLHVGTQAQSLDQDPEKEMATHSEGLPGKSHRMAGVVGHATVHEWLRGAKNDTTEQLTPATLHTR